MIEFFATVLNTEDIPRSMPHCGIPMGNGDVKKAPIYGRDTGYCNSPKCLIREGEEREFHSYCMTAQEIAEGVEYVERTFCECEKNKDLINNKGQVIHHYLNDENTNYGSKEILCDYCQDFCRESKEDE